MRASAGRRAEGTPWEGGRVAELPEGDGWAEGVGQHRLGDGLAGFSLGKLKPELACAPAPAGTSIPGWQRTNMATFPPKFWRCFAYTPLRLNLSSPGGTTLGEGGGPKIPLPKSFLDRDGAGWRGGGGEEDQTGEGWRCPGEKEGNPSKFDYVGWWRGPKGREGRGKEG